MSTYKPVSADQIKIWAETLGVPNLSEDAAEFLCTAVSQKIHSILDRACKNASYCRRTKILKSDIDAAMQFLNIEPTVDISTGDYIPIRGVSGVGGRTLFVSDDKDQDLHNLARKQGASAPLDIVLRQHWLAVEGKQPTVAENPSALSREEQKARASNPLVARKVVSDKAVRKSQMVSLKELAVSELSAEQQQFYMDITEAVIGSDEKKRREALHSIEHDSGLHALVPRLSVFISEGVKVNVVQQNLALLIYIMRLIKALLDNQTLYLQPYLHLIVPAVSSCIVSKILCSRPESDNHWALRGFAAKILATICKQYDSPTNRVSQRLIQIFKDALDDETTPLAARFGAYSALFELGNETIATMVLPRVKQEIESLRSFFNPATNPADKKAAEQIREKLLTRLSEYIRQTRPQSVDKVEEYRAEFGIFGQDLYAQIVKDRLKDPAKRPSIGGPSRVISPQNSITGSTIGSPAPRFPSASPAGIVGLASPSPISTAMSPPMFAARSGPTVVVNRLSSPASAIVSAGSAMQKPSQDLIKVPNPAPSSNILNDSVSAIDSSTNDVKREDGF